VPAKAVRPLTEVEIANLHQTAEGYAARGARYRAQLTKLDVPGAA
jgi:hypothetical protein